MGAILLTGGKKVVAGKLQLSKGDALGDPDDPLTLHAANGGNMGGGIQPCHAEKIP